MNAVGWPPKQESHNKNGFRREKERERQTDRVYQEGGRKNLAEEIK